MTLKEYLTQARALIADPAHWTQRENARDELGHYAGARNDPTAVKFCALGAVYHMNPGKHNDLDTISELDYLEREAIITLDLAAANVSGQAYSDLVRVNDTMKHHDVLRMFDLAIDSLQGD